MMALVEPPIAMCTLIALSKAGGVRIRSGVSSSHTMSTMRRPAAAHMRGWLESAAGIDDAPGSVKPSASAIAIMVAAVPITMQVPNERAMPLSISFHCSSLMVPARCSGSDVWKYWTEKRAGTISEEQWNEMESGIARSFGTCMVMGTAATMMAIAEALGLTLPGASSIPAADSSHPRMCAAAGRRIVDMVWEALTLERILTPAAFDNAIKVHMAMGGSTNAIIHVIAMARRAGIALDMQRFDQISREIPVLANVRPSGKYLMEDFFY